MLSRRVKEIEKKFNQSHKIDNRSNQLAHLTVEELIKKHEKLKRVEWSGCSKEELKTKIVSRLKAIGYKNIKLSFE